MRNALRMLGLALVLAAGAGAAPKPPTEVLLLEAVPGAWLEIPVGWASCDDELQAKLKGTETAQRMARKICATADPMLTFIVTGGLVPPVTVMAGLGPASELPAEFWDDLGDADKLEELRAATEDLNRDMLAGNGTLDGPLLLRRDMLDGRRALVSTFTITPDKIGKFANATMERWEVFDEGRLIIIAFSHPVMMAPAAEPVIDKIRSTIRFGRRL